MGDMSTPWVYASGLPGYETRLNTNGHRETRPAEMCSSKYEEITLEYEDYGGYDCMSAAWTIRRKDSRTLVCIDFADFESGSSEPSELAHKIFAMLGGVQKMDKERQ